MTRNGDAPGHNESTGGSTGDSSSSIADAIKTLTEKAEQMGTQALVDGNVDQAETVFKELLSIDRTNAIALNGFGLIAIARNEITSAELFFRDAIKSAPDWAIPHSHLGAIYLDQGRHRRAIRELNKALRTAPDDINIHNLLAIANQQTSMRQEQEKHLREVLRLDPKHGNANNDLGCIEIMRGNVAEAEKLLRIAVEANSPGSSAPRNLANVLLMKGDVANAEAIFSKLLQQDQKNIEALIGHASANRRLNNLEAALLSIERALSLEPDNVAALNLAGAINRELGDYDSATEQYSAALAIKADDQAARANLGMLKLLQGDWADAWPLYEARVQVQDFKNPWGGFNLPLWRGEDLNGKRILILSEQGYGDSIQFARFIPELHKRGADVAFAAQPELTRLFDGQIDGATVLDVANPKQEKFDYCALLMNLPGVLKINDPSQVDGTPYLKPKPVPDAVTQRLESLQGLKVGINWQGNAAHKEDRKRSIPLDALGALTSISGVSWVNLNFSDAADTPDQFTNVADLIDDFADSAALISALDLVITVDTATLHLAGSIGAKCWGLLSFVPDWRWGLQGSQTSWYNNLTLFRQDTLNGWSTVIDKVADELSTLAADKGA